MSTLHLYTQFGNTVVCCGQTAYLSISVTRPSKSRKGHYISYSPIPTILTLSRHIDLWFRVWHSICDHPESCLQYLLPPLCAESQPYNLRSSKGTRPNIGIRSHRWWSIGYRFFPILLNVGPDIIRTKWNGIGNESQFFIRPINIGHQKYLAAQITRHKSKSKSVNVVFYNLIFLINVSCLNRNLTSQFRTFVCISYDRVWPENIKFVYQNGHEKKQQVIQQRWRASFEWKTAQCTLQVYDLKMIILK